MLWQMMLWLVDRWDWPYNGCLANIKQEMIRKTFSTYITPNQNKSFYLKYFYNQYFMQSFLDLYWWHKANNVCIGHYRAEISDKHIVIHGNTLSEYQLCQSSQMALYWVGVMDKYVLGSSKTSWKINLCPFFHKNCTWSSCQN